METSIIDDMSMQYLALGCTGVTRLIDFLRLPKYEHLTEFGSSSIGLGPLFDRTDLSEEEKLRIANEVTSCLYIGDSVSPLEWFRLLLDRISEVSTEGRKYFDEICAEFADIFYAIEHIGEEQRFWGAYHGVTYAYVVPAGMDRDELTPEELQRYRVQGSEHWSEEKLFAFNARNIDPPDWEII